MTRSFKLLLFIVFLVIGCKDQEEVNGARSEHHGYILAELKNFRNEHNIPGLAFAIFNDSKIIDEISLGKSTYGHPIDQKTLFSIQSISKNVTAMAVMMAVQDSLVDLKTPITEYLPEFTVNSCFEEEPQDKITIEMLLSNTAGFTHEAPIGNNYDYRQVETEDHINSISETWLKFPVGNQYAYSNLGFDLATEIIAKQSGKSFEDYLFQEVFQPLNMESSLLEGERYISNENKTEGVIRFTQASHYPIPLIGSGAVYTNLSDFVKYSQFHLNLGRTESNQVLRPELLQELYRVRSQNYGLGTYVSQIDGIHFISHGGGGYGYTSSMIIFPEYNLGAVLLCNGNSSPDEFCMDVLLNHAKESRMEKHAEMTTLFNQINEPYFNDPRSFDHWERQYCDGNATYQKNWDSYTGNYAIIYSGYIPKWYTQLAYNLGFRPQKVKIYQDAGYLKIQGWFGESTLREFEEGLFIMEDGDVVDFISEVPTYRNIKLEKRN